MITPEEFEKNMKEIFEKHGDDPEICHDIMDELLAETLRSLGYNKGIEIFDKAERWYSYPLLLHPRSCSE